MEEFFATILAILCDSRDFLGLKEACELFGLLNSPNIPKMIVDKILVKLKN